MLTSHVIYPSFGLLGQGSELRMASKESSISKEPNISNEKQSTYRQPIIDVEVLSISTKAISPYNKTNVRPLRSPLYPPVKRLAYPTGTVVNNRHILSPRKLSKGHSPSPPSRGGVKTIGGATKYDENCSPENHAENTIGNEQNTAINSEISSSTGKPSHVFQVSSMSHPISPSERTTVVNLSQLKSFQTPSDKNENNISPKAIMNLSRKNSPESSSSSSPVFGHNSSEIISNDNNDENTYTKRSIRKEKGGDREKDKGREKNRIGNKEIGREIEREKERDRLMTPNFSGYIANSPSPVMSPVSPYLPYEIKKNTKKVDINCDMTSVSIRDKNEEEEVICPALGLNLNHLNLPPNSVDLRKMLGIVGNNILSVSSVVSSHAADAAVVVTSAVGFQAEKVLNSSSLIIPRFSNQDMSMVMIRKNALLDELSQSCMKLGMMEEKEKEMKIIIKKLNIKEAEFCEKQKIEQTKANNLENLICEMKENKIFDAKQKDLLSFQLDATRSELMAEVYVTETLRAKYEELEYLYENQKIQLKNLNDNFDTQGKMSEQHEEELEVIRQERERDLTVVQGELVQMFHEQELLREEMRKASDQAVAQITGELRFGKESSIMEYKTKSIDKIYGTVLYYRAISQLLLAK